MYSLDEMVAALKGFFRGDWQIHDGPCGRDEPASLARNGCFAIGVARLDRRPGGILVWVAALSPEIVE